MSAVIKVSCPACGLNLTAEELVNGIVITAGEKAVDQCPNCKRQLSPEDFGYLPPKKIQVEINYERK